MSQRSTRLQHIPGNFGRPVIGHTFEMMNNRDLFSKKMYETYGPVYKYRRFFEDAVALCGPEANEFVLTDTQKIFRQGYPKLFKEFFRNGLVLKDLEDHRFYRKALQYPFSQEKVQSYIPIIADTITQYMPALSSGSVTPMYPLLKKLLLNISATTLIGTNIKDDLTPVNQAFADVVSGCAAFIRLELPGLKYHKAKQARRYLEQYLLKLLNDHKRNKAEGNVLANLINAKIEDGAGLTDQEIIDQLIHILMAAHDTTTISVTSMVYFLARYPEWQERIYDEIKDLKGELAGLNIERLERLNMCDYVFNESIRLLSPAPGVKRKVTQAFYFKNYLIPENTTVALNFSLTHRMKEYWSHPEEFDPLRFSEERAEHKQHPFLWVPFGMGAHKCIGMKLARLEAKLILIFLLTHYRFKMQPGYQASFKMMPLPIPIDGLPLIVEKR